MQYPYLLIFLSLFGNYSLQSQTYTSYFTGNTTNVDTNPAGGVCLMGGATEDDNAMRWFLERANGGDVLVLRASGSDGYNDYLFTELGISVNSVETIVCNSPLASEEPYIQQRIQQAEAIWFAGGDQWKYVSYWRNTAIDSLINEAVTSRNIVIGGTSAGMAILGSYYFSAQNGTVTSSTALNNPFDANVTIDSLPFLYANYLRGVITDTHYDNPDRKGRHVVFLSRILTTYGQTARGIACDEYTAVCIDTNGMAKVYGGHPNYDDNAYFLQTNCSLANPNPEDCTPNNPLTWSLEKEAIVVYQIKGTPDGNNYFDLTNWETGEGGTWKYWYVDNGTLLEQPGTAISCVAVSTKEITGEGQLQLFPNPSNGLITIPIPEEYRLRSFSLTLNNVAGQAIKSQTGQLPEELQLNVGNYPAGTYYLAVAIGKKTMLKSQIIIR